MKQRRFSLGPPWPLGLSRRRPHRLAAMTGLPFLVMRGVLAGAAAAAAIGCSTAPETEGELGRPAGASHGVGEGDSVALGAAPAALSSDGAVCVTIQRGALGTVRDATLWQNAPGWNDSASPNLSTGSAAGAGLSCTSGSLPCPSARRSSLPRWSSIRRTRWRAAL